MVRKGPCVVPKVRSRCKRTKLDASRDDGVGEAQPRLTCTANLDTMVSRLEVTETAASV